jgi:hypothetical protein
MPVAYHPLVRLAKWTLWASLALAVLAVAGVWVAGRALPTLAAGVVSSRTGVDLACGDNATNLFVGRVDLADLVLGNPAGYAPGESVRIRRLVVDLDTGTFLADGTRVIEEVELDLDRVTLVGKGDLATDNNLTAIAKAWQASAGPAEPAAEPSAPETPAPGFVIRKLRLRVGGVTLAEALPSGSQRVILKEDRGLEFVATDVTQDNLASTVVAPITAAAMSRAASRPELLFDEALRRRK